MVFSSSSLDITNVINTLRSLDSIESAAQTIRNKLLNVDFGAQDTFFNSEELKLAWRKKKFQMKYQHFFSELFNIKKTMLPKFYSNEYDEIDKPEADENDVLK